MQRWALDLFPKPLTHSGDPSVAYVNDGWGVVSQALLKWTALQMWAENRERCGYSKQLMKDEEEEDEQPTAHGQSWGMLRSWFL